MGNTCRCSSTHERKSLGFIALTAWHAHILLKASQGTQSQKGSGQAQPTDCTSSRSAIFYSSTSHQIAVAARGETREHWMELCNSFKRAVITRTSSSTNGLVSHNRGSQLLLGTVENHNWAHDLQHVVSQLPAGSI